MNYHLGRILQYCFGLEVWAVSQVGETAELARQANIYPYDFSMPSISLADLAVHAGPDDILIACDMGSSFLLGWNFPGVKISYAQSLLSLEVLDMCFDHYISASDIIARNLKEVYGVYSPIVAPFINFDNLPLAPDWQSRPANTILPYRKGTRGKIAFWDASYERIRAAVEARLPSVKFLDPIFSGSLKTQSEILRDISTSRYVLMLTEMEGFGLIPLEAMAMGTIPVGYDGFGGKHYMQPGVNCATVPYAQWEAVVDSIVQLVQDDVHGRFMSERGKSTAREFGYPAFEAAWIREFSRILNLPVVGNIGVPYR